MNWKSVRALTGKRVQFKTMFTGERMYKTNDDMSVPDTGEAIILAVDPPSFLTMSCVTMKILPVGRVGSIPAEYIEEMKITEE